jgi:hypothetical protein
VLLLFPTSFFFTAVYSESLFLCLALLAIYLVDKKRWLAALLITVLVTATRVTGVFLVPTLMFAVNFDTLEWKNLLHFPYISKIKKNFMASMVLLFGCLGLGSYMLYLQSVFQDPLYFYHVQSEFGSGREERIIFWLQVVWRYAKMLLSQPTISLQTLTLLQEATAGILGVILLIISVKWIKPAWVFFGITAAMLPTLTGTFSSMPRYLLVCFPLFILIALFLQNNERWRWLYYLLSGMLLIVNTMLFIQGYWVA